ncbi:MAG: UTP--glucose-1-phosphate uridylyltransferase [Planctomycetaceae bacterium]
MKIEVGIVTAAGARQARLPFQRFIDLDGQEKSALRILAEEVFSAGIKTLYAVIGPGLTGECQAAVGRDYANRIVFVEQQGSAGYSAAVLQAAELAGPQPFLHLVGDHLAISADPHRRCAQQLVECARIEKCAVSAVQATREGMLPYYGAVGGQRIPGTQLIEIDCILEKPTPTQAEQQLQVPGVRTGSYLCFFGMHVLPPSLISLLREQLAQNPGDVPQFSDALQELARRERYLAMEVRGARHDLGIRYGAWITQLALGFAGVDREVVLSHLVEQLANQPQPGGVERRGGGVRGE